MSPYELNRLGEALPALIFLAVPSTALFVPVWAGKVSFLRLARAGARREVALWTFTETILCLCVWYLSQLFFAVLGFSLMGPHQGIAGALLAQAAATAAACGFAHHIVRRVIGQPAATLGLAATRASSYAGVLACHALAFLPLQAVSVLWTVFLHDVTGIEPQKQDVVLDFSKFVQNRDLPSIVFFVAAGVIVAPIGEEWIFRGVLHGYLRDRVGCLAGALVSGAVFAGAHRSLTGFVPLLVLGFILARIYDRSGSLYPGMLFHAAFNATSMAFLWLSL